MDDADDLDLSRERVGRRTSKKRVRQAAGPLQVPSLASLACLPLTARGAASKHGLECHHEAARKKHVNHMKHLDEPNLRV